MRTGIHLGLGTGHDKAIAYAKRIGCRTVQIFTHSPRSFQFKPLDEAVCKNLRDHWKNHDINPVYSHCNYLINLGSQDSKLFYASLSTVKKELEYCRAFGCDYFVLHVGKHKEGTLEQGMQQVAKGLNKLGPELEKYKVMILLETVAGQGTEIGAKFEELNTLLEMLDQDIQPHVGVAIDTCHIFAAGYDIRTKEGVDVTIKTIESTFGFARVKLIHVNDSKGDLGDHLDRHEHVGKGKIGSAGLKLFLNHPKVKNIPMVLETPVDDADDQEKDLIALNKLLN
jgi:deoxyribonuclease IV